VRLRDDSGNVRGFQQIRSEGMGSFHWYRYLIAALTKTMTMSRWQFPTRYKERTEIDTGNDLEGTNVTAETMVNHGSIASSRVETNHDGRYREHITLASMVVSYALHMLRLIVIANCRAVKTVTELHVTVMTRANRVAAIICVCVYEPHKVSRSILRCPMLNPQATSTSLTRLWWTSP